MRLANRSGSLAEVKLFNATRYFVEPVVKAFWLIESAAGFNHAL